MNENKKSDSDSLSKKHFAKFHERIFNKYAEMQRKLDKSRSMECLPTSLDDYDNKTVRHSVCDIQETEEIYEKTKSDMNIVKHKMIVEDVNRQDVKVYDLEEDIVYKSEVSIVRHKSENNVFFPDDFSSSIESIYDAYKENNQVQANQELTPTTPRRISIRDRIGTRISAVRERRREAKDKKRESREKVEKFIFTNNPNLDILKRKNKLASVTVALIEATGSENEPIAEEKPRLLYCRVRLGTEKRKTKTVKTTNNLATWQELFTLNMFEEQLLEITMWEKDALMGRCVLDLSDVEKEKTHKMRLNLQDGAANAQIFFLLTISGAFEENVSVNSEDQKSRRKDYSFFSTNFNDVGWLSIVVYGAKGLPTGDYYCLVELDNNRLQSHTELKTQNPTWMKILGFTVSDVTSNLVISVIDEKRMRSDVVGKICLPLLSKANGGKRWYALKDDTLRERANGHNPRILLEMILCFNIIKASLRVITPKEVNYLETEQEFSRAVFSHNVTRARAVVAWILDAFRFFKTCFEWESRKRNTIALTIWLLFWWFYRAWMMPLLLLIPFIWYKPPEYSIVKWRKKTSNEMAIEPVVTRSTTLRERLSSLTELIQTVQNSIGRFASIGESIKNLTNFTVPFLSFLAIFIILLITIVVYLIPVNYIFMFWGVHKFLRKIIRPNRIPNSEILDLLSRVPDDVTLLDCAELDLEELPQEDTQTQSRS